MIPAGGRVLGLDLGERRIGVAISDASRTLASPVDTIDGRDRPAAHRAVRALVEEWEAVGVVVGLPRSLSGRIGPAERKVRAELDALTDAAGVPVDVVDERFTTVEADRLLRESAPGRDSRQRRAVIDQTAAAVLLQAWLDGRTGAEEDR